MVSGIENITKRDMAIEPYARNESEVEHYNAIVNLLREMAANGKLEFEADNPDAAYAYHLISIRWRLVDELVSVDFSDLREMVAKLNGNLTIIPGDASDWLISCELYTSS